MLKTYRIYKKYISTLRLAYKKPSAFAICALILDFVAFVHFAFLNQGCTQKLLWL
ncbi:hypothetical protein Hanom_Chr16g01517611 [Helianthus anomalus]